MEDNNTQHIDHRTAPENSNNETINKPAEHPASRLGRLKVAFLYTLIGGLSFAAITSVVALLIGEFSAVIGKTLLTIFVLFSHSLLLLAILWADKDNKLGKAIISTTIFVAVFANIITATLGAWDILSGETVWRWIGFYFLAIGGAYIVAALLRLRIDQHAVHIAVNTSIGFIVVTLASVAPWVLAVVPQFDPLYFRIIGALSILSSASFLIALILRGIALSKNPSLRTKPEGHILPNGMLVIYIIFGVITSLAWNIGVFSLLDSGSTASSIEERSYN